MKQTNMTTEVSARVEFGKWIIIITLAIVLIIPSAPAQTNSAKSVGEQYGRTLNLGLGFAYAPYWNRSSLLLMGNYEFDVAKQFTLAPFVGYASYRSDAFPENNRRYYYHQTIIPIGVKGTYYFDNILNAGSDWDFYLAGSLGFVASSTRWDDGYTGNRGGASDVSPLYLGLHIGTEYHISQRAGLFVDLATVGSTVGLSIHGR